MVTINKPKVRIGTGTYTDVSNTTTSKPIYSREEILAIQKGKIIATSR